MKHGRVAVVVGPRAFPFGGIVYSPGKVIHVSAATADRMEAARPPYGRRVQKDEVGERGDVDPWAGFTDAARQTLENAGIGGHEYGGARQEDGRVHVTDVRDWLAARASTDG